VSEAVLWAFGMGAAITLLTGKVFYFLDLDRFLLDWSPPQLRMELALDRRSFGRIIF
jgi:hypothetical protein